MRKLLFALVVVSLLPQSVEARMRTISWDPVTTYTDNTLIVGKTVTYQSYWTNDVNLAPGNLNPIPMADNTLTSASFDDAIMQADSPVYFTAIAVLRETGESSALSPGYLWYPGSSGSRGPSDVRLMELPWSTGRGNFAVSFSAPRDASTNPAYYRAYYKANSYDNVMTGAMVYQGTRRSFCFSDGGNINNGVFIQVVGYADNGAVLGWSEKAFFLPGAIDCQDINTCRVDFAHTFSVLDPLFGRYLSEFGLSPRQDVPQCGTDSEFIVPVHTLEQKADRSGDGRIGPEDELDTAPLLGNRTTR
jgi:hypothetical protein